MGRGEETSWSGRDTIPQPGPGPSGDQGLRGAEDLLRLQGEALTGNSLPGLSPGPRSQVQAGTLPKPRLWAESEFVIPRGEHVILWCEGTLETQEYLLVKEGSPAPWDTQAAVEPGNKAKFPLSSMTDHHEGLYHCCYQIPYVLSEYREPLELVVTGRRRQAQALFHVGHVIPSTAWRSRCYSYDGSKPRCGWMPEMPWSFRLRGLRWAVMEVSQNESRNRAEFSIPSMTEDDAGRYCCYCRGPAGWSEPSEPLELVVTGSSAGPGLQGKNKAVIWVSVPFSLLLLLLLLLLFFRYWRQGRSRKADAAVKDTAPEDRVELDTRSPPAEDPQGATYAQAAVRVGPQYTICA
ncbi:PREDICTED: leukocyte immunoglobulin-like receptor subfamily B member 4 [Chinchilla lanigera]|uniref:leukocyte immunoglobulin-like receptor subfamily B member 4 n=1 Tax=Chinchilla lanigera TaxID=34839 RepID=UPI000695B2C2|nr:PREDICTED: leukocyte immunoglobulin-like receptor subfamily B member 4 [Chinchilla lanigera]